MKQALTPAYFFIPLVYVLVIAGLLFLQFSGATLFQTDVGPVSMTASFELGGKNEEKQLSTLTLNYLSMVFPFSDQASIEVQNQDETVRTLGLKSYEKLDNGFSIGFEEDIFILATVQEGEKAALNLEVKIPRVLLPLKSVRIPYSIARTASASPGPNNTSLLVTQSLVEYQLSLPPRSFVDAENTRLVIPGDGESKNIVFGIKAKDNRQNIEALFDSRLAGISESDYNNLVKAHIDAAYAAWRGQRYNSARNNWTIRDSETAFKENILVNLLAEAWQRNEYPRAIADMRAAADANTSKLTHRSAVFLGNLRKISSDMVTLDAAEVKRLLTLIQENNNDLLLEKNLIQFAADRGTRELRDALRLFFERVKPEDLNPQQLLGLLQQFMLYEIVDPAFNDLYNVYKEQFRTLIAKNIMQVDEGVFYMSAEGKSTTYNNILAGAILIQAGKKENDQGYQNLGRMLIGSSLKLGDDQGYLPGEIEFSAGAISAMYQTLAPEDIYEFIHNNPSYPRYHSLYAQTGPGQWFYTIAQVNSITIKPGEYTFNISYPRTRTHYMIFAGMPTLDPTRGVQLFGIPWRSAPDFEIYAKGRFYSRDTKFLLIKYFADSTNDVIKLWF